MIRAGQNFRFVLIFTLLTCLPSALQAADSWPVPRGPSREPSPRRYDPGEWQQVPRDYLEDAAACILYSATSSRIEPDGTIETTIHEITRLNGRTSIEALGEYRSVVYDPSYQTLTLNEAAIHKADGKRTGISPRHVQLRDVSTNYQVYDHEKQLIISFPSLEVGDVIEVKWTTRGKNPEHLGHFFTRYTFGDTRYPVVTDELRVQLPRQRALKYASLGGKLEPVRTESPDQVSYSWQARHCKRLPQDENLPPREELRPTVCCSTFASWDEIGQWKQRLRAECWVCTPEIRKIVDKLTRNLADATDKARALTYWIRRNIRYVSAGERHDYTPHLPGQILANRYGDCKDTSQLLAVMLREAGLTVELATLGVRDDGQVLAGVPSPWGTHAILLVTIGDKQHWIDTTVSLGAWNYLPRDDCERQCYLVDDKGRCRLQRTPALAPANDRIEQNTTVWIGPDGSTRCLRHVISHGRAAVRQRDTFLEVPAGERRRQVTSDLQDANNRSRLVRVTINEPALRDLDKPVTADILFEIPGQFSGSSELEGSFTDSKVWSKLLSHNVDPDRQFALELPGPFDSTHRLLIHLAPNLVFDGLPRNRTVRSAWGTFSRKVRAVPGHDSRLIEVELHTRLDRPRVEKADLESFRKFQDDVAKHYRVWFTLKPAKDLADAPAMEALLALTPEDAVLAAALTRLYQEHSRHADARRVLARARHYVPDDETLGELAVRSAASLAEEEKLQEELVKRFPDNLQHALELGIILVKHRKHAEARKVLEPVTHKGTPFQQSRAHFQMARSHYRTDELPEALRHIQAAAKADSDGVNTVSAHHLHGLILEEQGKPDEAMRAQEQALEVDRDSLPPLEALIRLAQTGKRPALALEYLRRYSLAVRDDLPGLQMAAEHYYKLGRLDDALELATRARDLNFHERTQRLLGLIYLRRGDLTLAHRHLDRAGLDNEVLESLIRCLLGQGLLTEAGDRADQLERIDKPSEALKATCATVRRLLQRRIDLLEQQPAPPGQESAWKKALGQVICAEQAQRDGKPVAQVETLVQSALELAPDLGVALALRGRLALDRGRLARALEDGGRAVLACPRQPGGYYVRGRVRLERQQDGALTDLQKAAELCQRQDADILAALAQALSRAGQDQEALTAQREAAKLKPADPEIAHELAVLEKKAGSEE